MKTAMDFESDIYRLEGTTNEKGGLIIKKKPPPAANFEFKVPKVSLLGLDKIAGMIQICSEYVWKLYLEQNWFC